MARTPLPLTGSGCCKPPSRPCGPPPQAHPCCGRTGAAAVPAPVPPLQPTDPCASEELACKVPQSQLCVLHGDGPQWGASAWWHPAAMLLCLSQQRSGLLFYRQHFWFSLLYFNEGPAVTTDLQKKKRNGLFPCLKKIVFHLSEIFLR